jgi:hypothetical protein
MTPIFNPLGRAAASAPAVEVARKVLRESMRSGPIYQKARGDAVQVIAPLFQWYRHKTADRAVRREHYSRSDLTLVLPSTLFALKNLKMTYLYLKIESAVLGVSGLFRQAAVMAGPHEISNARNATARGCHRVTDARRELLSPPAGHSQAAARIRGNQSGERASPGFRRVGVLHA